MLKSIIERSHAPLLPFFSADELRGLEWNMRLKIIKEICQGLEYLHMEKHIIHMDLKPANVLLDIHMSPKITDFGLSRMDENSHTISSKRFLSM
jgi:interleukin-1 receptor-associated kinase 1/coatomer subunit beta'